MTLLSTYLSKSKVKKVLETKPGQEGFSLIELVVVVAVLAVLSAIAIPNFTNISNKARAAAAANTLATIAKECATKIADAGSGTFNVPGLQGYDNDSSSGSQGFLLAGTEAAIGTTPSCPSTGTIAFISENEDEYPSWTYNVGTGAKTCAATSGKPAATGRGCVGTSW
mgnify:CR=1 FL=1